MSDPERKPDVAISASFRAREMRVKVPPRARIAFEGEGHVETRRVGIPPEGTAAGETYQDVEVATEIASRARERPRRS